MADAIELLLQGKLKHEIAQELLTFHCDNRDFIPRVVGELRLLQKQGRREASAKSLFHFLRWEKRWETRDAFEVNDHLEPMTIRICMLLWPDINGMVRLNRCEADQVLRTRIVHRADHRYGNFVRHSKDTVNAGVFLRPKKCGNGLARPMLLDGMPDPVFPPDVPVLDRPPTFHESLSKAEAVVLVEPLHHIAAITHHPRHRRIRAWVRHFQSQPEIFAFMQKTLVERQPECFSANSLLEYARWSIRRAAVRDKKFSLPNDLGGMYCRALIALHSDFNGRCEFRDRNRRGGSNWLLGCSLAPELSNGEPYRRLIWPGVIQ